MKEYVITVKAEELMRGSFDTWVEFLSSNTVEIDKLSNKLLRVSEIFQRRNLFVHNNGIVNHVYIKKTKR